MQFYLLIEGQERGPYSPDDVRRMAAGGGIKPADLAWREGLAEWAPLSSLEEFAGAFSVTKSVPRPNRRSGALAVGVIAVVVIVAAVIGVLLWTGLNAPAPGGPTAAAAAAALEPDLPKTFSDLDRWYSQPDPEQNAATLYQNGFESIRLGAAETNSTALPVVGKAKTPELNAPLSAATKAALTGTVQRNREALEFFQQASRRTASRYRVDLSAGLDASMPHLRNAKRASQLLFLAALSQADGRQEQAARDSILASLALSRSLDQEPVLISQLVRVACVVSAKAALEHCFNRVALTEESLQRLQAAFDQAAENETAGESFHRALVGESVAARTLGEMTPDELVPKLRSLGAEAATAAKSTGRRDEDRTFALESLRQYRAAFRQPYPLRVQADDLLVARRTEAMAQSFSISAAFLAPGTAKRAASVLAWLRLAQTAIALERFRVSNQGRIPSSLTELVPTFLTATPQDPFDGQTLRYRPASEGYKLYSVGGDLQDDKGEEQRNNRGDLVFQLVTAPKRP